MDKGYSDNAEIIKKKGHQGYLLTQDFTPEDEDDGSLVASADSQDDDADTDDDAVENVYQKVIFVLNLPTSICPLMSLLMKNLLLRW